MAVSAKLSSRFQQTLGDEAALEMVDWMQRVDAHQAELRSLNELNVARYEASLSGRVAEVRQEIGELRQEMLVGFANLRPELHVGLATLRRELHAGLAQVAVLQASLVQLRQDVDVLNQRMDRLEQRFEALSQTVTNLFKWSFGFWIGTLAVNVGMVIAILKLVR